MKNKLIKKRLLKKCFSSCPSIVFNQKLFVTVFSINDSLHKLHFHVHYEEVYLYKSFQKFSIKTLTKIAYPNFKNKQKIGFNPLGVKKGVG